MRIGIQGGRGSFNEEAVNYFLKRNVIEDAQIIYFHTTEQVLSALSLDEIDRGQFAIHNSSGGIVWESIIAMGQYTFTVLEEFAIKISHAMMIRPDADYEDIDMIMTHPQVIAQGKKTLSNR